MEILPELKRYLTQKRWKYKPVGNGNLAIKTCPFCGKSKSKFWIHATKTIYRCWNCDARGNLYKLKRELGDLKGGVVSATKLTGGDEEKAKGFDKTVSLKSIEKMHRRLLKDERALEYLDGRGFSIETIKHFKLGLLIKSGRWLAIPHINDGICFNVKFRSLPPADKTFRRMPGHASVLFNQSCLADAEEIVLVEAETDAMSFWQAGVLNVVGLTCGADTFLPEWYDLLADKTKITIVMDADSVGQKGARDIARRLGFDRCWNVMLPGHDANEVLTRMGPAELSRSLKHAEQFEVSGVVSVADALSRCREDAELGEAGLLTPWAEVNHLLGPGWQPGDLIVLSAKVKIGKALAHGQRVWTVNGERPIEAIRTGDLVLGRDGKPYPVKGVFPQGQRSIYKVRFSDESTLDVDGDHIWTVQRYTDGGQKTVVDRTTTEMLEDGLRYRNQWRFSIPMPDPLMLPGRLLELDPYVMGVCLGDGCLTNTNTGVRISNVDKETRANVEMGIPDWMVARHHGGVTISVANKDKSRCRRNPVRAALKRYGVLGCRAEEKMIPTDYLLSSINDRVELLRGLMDTDGTMAKTGQLTYTTTSYQLALDVKYLVETLGGRASILPRKSKGQPAFDVNLSVHSSVTPFLQAAKRRRFEQHRKRTTRQRNFRSVVAITPVGKEEATCISVASPDRLFVCQNGIVTHNTTWSLQQALHLASENIPCLFFCLEMRTERLAQKVAAHFREKPVEELTAVDYSYARYMVRQMPFYFVEPDWGGSLKMELVFDKIREAVRRHGIRLLVFDHLHFLCRSLQYITTEVGQVTRGFKLLCEELGITTILIAQPRKIQGDRVMKLDDIKDSSAIPADADQIILLHRTPRPAGFDGDVDAAEDAEVLEPKTLVRIDAARFRGGGECVLYYDGATATFHDWKDRPIKEL